ncbi:hypothetical protein HPG69_018065 [Diceros bicornis minor]|uniref:Uncharacterized protein n=1 Tax=Diceros bicornis minor TaxID=77932 RepID=A0A7J7F801_DICBM|nr:hypothetical protein HPG69_018065 [Diceros bicornis minor]
MSPLCSYPQLSKEYNPVYRAILLVHRAMYLGSRQLVVLSGYQTMKEALVDHDKDFSGWSDFLLFSKFNKENARGMSYESLVNRLEKQSLEKQILEEVSFLMSCSLCNTICSMLCSCFDYEDEHLVTITWLLQDSFQIINSHWGKYNFSPRLLDCLPGPHHCLFHNLECLKDLITYSICEHQASFDPSSPPDFINCSSPRWHATIGHHAFLALLKYPKVRCNTRGSALHKRHSPEVSMSNLQGHSITWLFAAQRMDIIILLNTVHRDPSQLVKPPRSSTQSTVWMSISASRSDLPSCSSLLVSGVRVGVTALEWSRMCLGKSLASMALPLPHDILQSFSLQPLGVPKDINLTPIGPGPNKISGPFQMTLCKC